MFSAGLLFPLEVTKTNLQAHTKLKKGSTNTTSGDSEAKADAAAATAAAAAADDYDGDGDSTVVSLVTEEAAAPAATAAAVRHGGKGNREGTGPKGAEEEKVGDRLLETWTTVGFAHSGVKGRSSIML